MSQYSEEFKGKIVQKMMPPNSQSVAQIHRDTGIPEGTLYTWKNNLRSKGEAVPANPSNPENWGGKDKLAIVIETASLNEQELSEYCRKRGFYTEQVASWTEGAIAGNDAPERLNKVDRRELQQLKKKCRNTERELRRKEKALAEVAALLVLEKKAQAIWGGTGEG